MKNETLEKISVSDAFLVIGTDHYFKDPKCLREANVARTLGKKFFILLAKDTVIPEGFLEGVEWKINTFDPNSPQSLKIAMEKLFENFKKKEQE